MHACNHRNTTAYRDILVCPASSGRAGVHMKWTLQQSLVCVRLASGKIPSADHSARLRQVFTYAQACAAGYV
eukprot:7849192-Alexandrium_andersonii.AAC.1